MPFTTTTRPQATCCSMTLQNASATRSAGPWTHRAESPRARGALRKRNSPSWCRDLLDLLRVNAGTSLPLRPRWWFVDSDELLLRAPGGAVSELDLDLARVGERGQVALRGGPRNTDLGRYFGRRHR